MAELAAAACGVDAPAVLVCSTGVIGVPLPMDRVEHGIAAAGRTLSESGGAAAAVAICTTDSQPKTASRELDGIRIGGMAKGAGMIRPDLGTMIAVVTTDAALAPQLLAPMLARAADASFNRITVDGCTSTSDSVLVLANGAAGAVDADALEAELTAVCEELALAIVSDGEGARRVGRYEVVGARTAEDAARAARHVAEDQLVRCALHGADPNWGRIVAALGVCGVELDPDRLGIDIGDVAVVRDGVAVAGAEQAAGAAAAADEVHVRIDLALRGDGTATIWGSDLSPTYVLLNSEYTT
jgi:glutamate N-acetyltransferase/amino-acid N-acetyltransferase